MGLLDDCGVSVDHFETAHCMVVSLGSYHSDLQFSKDELYRPGKRFGGLYSHLDGAQTGLLDS